MTDHTHTANEQPSDRRGVRADDRGISEVLGSILVFGLVILLVSLVQLNAVPAANQQVEFEHNQRVQGDLQEFQEGLLRTANTGAEGAVKIEAGMGYPQRFFLFNPPRVSGTVSVTDVSDTGPNEVVIRNAVASGEAEDYMNGDDISIPTRAIRYSANYNEYRNAPTTVYENGVLFNEFENGQRVIQNPGALINGRTISLVAIQGDLSTSSSGSIALSTTPISGPAQEVSVSGGTAGESIKITIPTGLSKSEWENDLLADELFVEDVLDNDDGTITVVLKADETYDLKMAAAAVGSGFDTETSAEYIVDVSGSGETVPEGGSQRLVVQVRDKFNNPVSNVVVAADADSGSAVLIDTDRTNSNGEVAINYAPGTVTPSTDTRTVTAWFTTDGSNPTSVTDLSSLDPKQKVEISLTATDTDGSGDDTENGNGDDFNPATGLVLESANLRKPASDVGAADTCPRSQDCVVDVTFKNTNSNPVDIRSMRFSVYAGVDGNQPSSAKVDGSSSLDISEGFETVSLSQVAKEDGTQTYEFEFSGFNKDTQGSVEGDVFIVEIITESGGQFTSTSYLVAPKEIKNSN